MFDDQFQRQIAGERSQQAKAVQGATELAALLSAFRVQLILGGFPPEDATEMAREYFEHLVALHSALPAEEDEY